jgi:peptidoglycan/xylan/chitin deacetylase (PgdA/CDA1 family)
MDSDPGILERTAIEIMFRSGISRAFAKRYGGRGAVYMFHSVVPDRSACLTPGLSTTAKFLDRLLASFRRSDIDIIGVDDLILRLQSNNTRRFVVATFDDGYADNLQYALPIFEKHKASLAVYVTTGMITGSLYCWWIALERLFLQNATVEIPPMERRWTALTMEEKAQAFSEASDWVSQDIAGRSPLLRSTFAHYGLSMPEIARSVGLNIDQLKMLGSHPLVTIGGHTESHPELPRLEHAEARKEIVLNKRFLENLLQKTVDHFAYPYGACGQREATLVQEAGYKTAVTTQHGCVFERFVLNPHILPRVSSSPYESLGLAHLKVDGLIAALRHGSMQSAAR